MTTNAPRKRPIILKQGYRPPIYSPQRPPILTPSVMDKVCKDFVEVTPKFDIGDKVYILKRHIIIKTTIEAFEIYEDNSIHYWVGGLCYEDQYIHTTLHGALKEREEYYLEEKNNEKFV